MVVRFAKPRNDDRPPTMTFIRDDGSSSGMPSSGFFVRHDLTHFAVETILGLDDAFYGLVSRGWDISSFEEREPNSRKSRTLPAEAILAEVTVGALDLDWAAGPLPAPEVVSYIAGHLASIGNDLSAPTADQIETMRLRRGELLGSWDRLTAGESLELNFPLAD